MQLAVVVLGAVARALAGARRRAVVAGRVVVFVVALPGRAGVVAAAGTGVASPSAPVVAVDGSESPSSWSSHSWPHLIRVCVGDHAGDRVAAEQVDRQLAGGRVVRGDRAGVLVAVHDAVVVGVAVARVVARLELAAVVEVVAVLVAAAWLTCSERWCRFSQRSGMRSWLRSLAAAMPGSASSASAPRAASSTPPSRARLPWRRLMASSLVASGEWHFTPLNPRRPAKITRSRSGGAAAAAEPALPPSRSSPSRSPSRRPPSRSRCSRLRRRGRRGEPLGPDRRRSRRLRAGACRRRRTAAPPPAAAAA